MGQMIRGQGASDLSTLREETKRRTREMAAEYGKQKQEEEEAKNSTSKQNQLFITIKPLKYTYELEFITLRMKIHPVAE